MPHRAKDVSTRRARRRVRLGSFFPLETLSVSFPASTATRSDRVGCVFELACRTSEVPDIAPKILNCKEIGKSKIGRERNSALFPGCSVPEECIVDLGSSLRRAGSSAPEPRR